MEGYLKSSGVSVTRPSVARAGTDVTLRPGELYILPGDARGVAVSCQKGQLWITQESDPQDHLLRAGERFVVGLKGEVIVQNLCGEGRARIVRAGARA